MKLRSTLVLSCLAAAAVAMPAFAQSAPAKLPSGLVYESLKDGNGASPAATDVVRVHYRGTLADGGTEFDSSYKRGEPAVLPLQGVIPGWAEGLQLMPVGAKYRFWIPSQLAYGSNGAPGGMIGPEATLTFDVELLGIAP